jgi:anti-sigma factor RsiW
MTAHAHGRGRCRDLATQISDHLDGDLSPARASALERHLAECACCTAFAESLRRAILACRASGRSTLPADVRRRARARIAEIMRNGGAKPRR